MLSDPASGWNSHDPERIGSKQVGGLGGKGRFLYLLHKADTPGCTTQACSHRDARQELDAAGAVVLGISPDKPAAQARFDTKHGLGFPLLSDPDHAVAEAYGAWGERSMYGKKYMGIIRSAFVIDQEGRIAETLYKVSPRDTVPRALQALSG